MPKVFKKNNLKATYLIEKLITLFLKNELTSHDHRHAEQQNNIPTSVGFQPEMALVMHLVYGRLLRK